MTEPCRAVMAEEYAQNDVKYVDPLSEHGSWEPDLPDQWHVPLMSLGSETGNHMFCRVSFSHGDPETLWVTFRPFMLDDLVRVVGSNIINAVRRLASSAVPKASEGRTSDNLINILKALSDTRIRGTGICAGATEGYARLLTNETVPVFWENGADALAKTYPALKSKLTALKKEFSVVQRFGAKFQSSSIAATVASLVRCWKPKNVVFCGFSLGGGSSVACAAFVSRILGNSFRGSISAVSFAGTMPGDSSLAEYIKRRFQRCDYVQMVAGDKADPTTFIPFSPDCVHSAADFWTVDFRHGTFDRSDAPRVSKRADISVWPLFVADLLLRLPVSKKAGAFRDVHLPGEDGLARALALRIAERYPASKIVRNLRPKFFAS